MKKRDIYLLIVIVIISIIVYFFVPRSSKIIECQTDADCIPASCCHPDSCVPITQKPNCTGLFCSFSCEGPLDCGAGTCGCKKNKCTVIPNE